MKSLFLGLRFLIMMGVVMLPLGCGQKEGDHGKESVEGGHGEESPSGATFKVGKGITFEEETSKIIGLEVLDVTEEILPEVVQVNVQIFTETHRLAKLNMDHTGCKFHGSGFLASEKANLIKPKQSVKFQISNDKILDGFVVAIQKPLIHGESEIIVGVTTPESGLKDGEFVKATIFVSQGEPVTTIPSSALLRTVEGTYVYVVNGDAYYRTAVTVGGSTEGKIEITDGLYAGDQVVSKPVETLWIIELRATKGGGHSH
jgi:hypothetical protein